MTHMPFGKYKGFDLCDLPEDYVTWLLDQEYVKDPLRGALIHLANKPPASVTPISSGNPALKAYIRQITLEGFKVGLERLKGQPDKLKNLQAAREHMETVLDL